MGKLEKPVNTREQYRCYTYKEEMNEDQLYYMSQRGSEMCGNLGQNSNITYKVLDESKGNMLFLYWLLYSFNAKGIIMNSIRELVSNIRPVSLIQTRFCFRIYDSQYV